MYKLLTKTMFNINKSEFILKKCRKFVIISKFFHLYKFVEIQKFVRFVKLFVNIYLHKFVKRQKFVKISQIIICEIENTKFVICEIICKFHKFVICENFTNKNRPQ